LLVLRFTGFEPQATCAQSWNWRKPPLQRWGADLRFAICLRCAQNRQQSRDALKAPRDFNSRPAPKNGDRCPLRIGGAPCLRQFRIRVQVLPLKHVASRPLLDGMSESLGSTASGSIFLASSRSGKPSGGSRKEPRPGCRRIAKRPSLILRSRDRIEPALVNAKTKPTRTRPSSQIGPVVWAKLLCSRCTGNGATDPLRTFGLLCSVAGSAAVAPRPPPMAA
jgi:hypothetical protein